MVPYQYIDRPTPFNTKGGKTLPVFAVTPAHIETGTIDPIALDWARKVGFKAESGALLLIPTEDGHLGGALFGLGSNPSETPFLTGKLARTLPAGDWHIETAPLTANRLLLGYGLGAYKFTRYRTEKPSEPTLLIPQDADAADIKRQLAGVYLARDLINTPTNDMGPAQLEAAFRALAAHYGAETSVITGAELLDRNFPLVHTVGRASADAPRLLEMRWGKKGHRRITLVGKGVCFDTGGLDIKPADGMRNMKKDMGGAAHALALARLLMQNQVPVRLTLLIAAVENAIAGNAFRPGDVIVTRQGLSVEIDNTDAEGRLVLADALTLAGELKPDLIMDFATLTGAARIALGPDLPVLFSNHAPSARDYLAAGEAEHDPLWQLPLWQPYLPYLKSNVADLANAGASKMAGCMTAALFLQRFVPAGTAWTHLDVYSWNDSERPGKPAGGEAQGLRAAFRFLQEKYDNRHSTAP